jgi:hypothetical protein
VRHQAETTCGLIELGVDIFAEDKYLAAGFIDQRGDNTDGGGFSRAIGAEQGKEVA